MSNIADQGQDRQLAGRDPRCGPFQCHQQIDLPAVIQRGRP